MRVMKLTPAMLRRIVKEEVSKGFGAVDDVEDVAKDTDEVDADEYADSIGKHIDYVKALKVEEGRLTARLTKIREAKQRILKGIVRKVG